MNTVETQVHYLVNKDVVFNAYWRLENWPEVAKHVEKVDIIYEEFDVQHLIMHVMTKGNLATFKSVRSKMEDIIYYFQSNPPPFLKLHFGCWKFKNDSDGGTIVESRHYFESIEDKAIAVIKEMEGLEKVEDVNGHIARLLCANSRQTMLALKDLLEYNLPV